MLKLFSFLRPRSRPTEKGSDSEAPYLDINMDDFQPSDPPRRYRTKSATVVQDYSGTTVTTDEGAIYRLDRDGRAHVQLPTIRRMEIADLTQVLSHQVNRVHETTSHVIHFIGGGVFSCVYDDHGEMIEIDCRGLHQASSLDGVVTVYGSHKRS